MKEGLILDFGTRMGGSALKLSNTGKNVYTFDAFLGLRDAWSKPGRGPGSMSLAGVPPEILRDIPNVSIVEGWIEDTLGPFLESHQGRIALAHLDFDVCPPTKFTLEQIKGRLDCDSLIVFDDYFGFIGWQNHSHKAFIEVFGTENFKMVGVGPGPAIFLLEPQDC